MESTLFTTLTVTEEATLSGGGRHNKKKSDAAPSAAPTTALLPTPLVNLNNIIQLNIVVLSDYITASNTAAVK